MGKRVNPATVGAFVLGAIGLILVAVVVFGSGHLFRKTHEFVIYFAGDINGLRVGAPVKFKGVEIGMVQRIKLRLEQDVNPSTASCAPTCASRSSSNSMRKKSFPTAVPRSTSTIRIRFPT